MTWENTKRITVKARKRSTWHQTRMDAEPTQKRKLSAACQWLISEAWQANQLDHALDHVLTFIDQIRKENRHDRDDHGA